MGLCPIPSCRTIETQGHMFMCPRWECEILTRDDFYWDLWNPAADLAAEMVNIFQLYPRPRVYILKELEKRVNAHYRDKKLDLDMRRGWKKLTEKRKNNYEICITG
ncbi:hypothetical protein LPJ66_002665 [Kickxella alabastrina]|uniref:Uncharacterized protein n=1 Tax=Kickxella alabastrina TaxID=61397 RepID=A0ACC1IPV6_9FUNG|nr:hypothetical protein LPJ66_002665 [Kickxella alabastrina]